MNDSQHTLKPVLDAAAMRAADACTIHDLGIPGFALMETAGREAARIMVEKLRAIPRNPGPVHAVVCVGKGNNGGDGLVVARWLLESEVHVRLLLTAASAELSVDCAANLRILERMQADGLTPNLSIQSAGSWSSDDLEDLRADLWVDALFGTGLESALRPPFDAIVYAINRHAAPVVALDVPSGLSASSGQAFEACIRAEDTITMGALKAGLLLDAGPDLAGTVHVVDIGIPSSILAMKARSPGSGFESTDAWVANHLRPRSRQDHKYTTGPALVVGGSAAFPGAPALAARAAARIGSGYVVAIGPDAIRTQLQETLDAIPVAGWTSEGSVEDAAARLVAELGTRWNKARALLIGPGMGRERRTQEYMWALLDRFEGPVVLDADALFALVGQRERVATASKGRWVLTPHEGELNRLDVDDHDESRITRMQRMARDWNCVILGKGQPSITASPDGRTIINATGHPAAATAGSGDVLAGITTGLLAQGLEPLAAAAAGIHIGGTAARQFVERGASQSLVASDIIDALPGVLRQLT